MVRLNNALRDLQSLPEAIVRAQVPLADFATYRIGGPAEVFFEPQSEAALMRGLEYVHKSGITFFILGSGSNLLVADEGYAGVVFHLGPQLPWQADVLREDAEHVWVRVPAWASKAELLSLSLRRGWAGLEFSAGIPGTLGGAVFMNAGTKWGAYADVIESVRLYHVVQGFQEKSVAEMGFRYRGHGEASLGKEAVVLSVDLKLRKAPNIVVSQKLVQEILAYRGEKQPLERPNCGSVFKNPENSARGAGRLIEAAGLKQVTRGGAMFSDKHANFILNVDGASAADVRALIELAQTEVAKQFSIQLEREVIFVE